MHHIAELWGSVAGDGALVTEIGLLFACEIGFEVRHRLRQSYIGLEPSWRG